MDKVKQNNILPTNFLLRIFIFLLILMQVGCSATPLAVAPEAIRPQPQNIETVLEPGDQIEIKFALWPELNEIQRIRPDGQVSLQLIENVHAAGLTTDQLKQHLQEKYKHKINNPEILVIVRELASKQVYVTGNINHPGPIPLQNRMTALEAVMAAGGFSKPFVNTIIIYRTIGNRVVSTSLKIDDYTGDNPQGADPFYVQAKDMIQVR